MANDYGTARSALNKAIGAAQGQPTGSIDAMGGLTVDQQLKAAEIAALLSISQELSALNPLNTTYHDTLGVERNGWGLPTGR